METEKPNFPDLDRELEREDDNPSYGSRQGSKSYQENLKQQRKEDNRIIKAQGTFNRKMAKDAVVKFRKFYSTLTYDERTEYGRMSAEEKEAFRKKKESEPRFE